METIRSDAEESREGWLGGEIAWWFTAVRTPAPYRVRRLAMTCDCDETSG